MNKTKRDQMDAYRMSREIIEGRRLRRGDDMEFFMNCDLQILSQEADRLRKHFNGDKVDLCTIISGKSGACGENCRFCAQSVHNHTGCDVHGLLDFDMIYADAKQFEEEGVDRLAIVISGRSPSEQEFDKIINIYERLNKKLNISLCASLGFLTAEQFERLYNSGVRCYHNNIETSRGYFSSICTTHTFDDKVANIRRAKAAGLIVCSGGIIGMGENLSDRIDMAFDLSELGIQSIPINVLIPIRGTPLENQLLLSEEDVLRTVAIFRFINPESSIRLAAGRKMMTENGKYAFAGGASAAITGNMLTTLGTTIQSDRSMLLKLGRRIV